MIPAVDLRAGMAFVQDGKLIKVLEASHHKPGKGNTVMRMKLRDIRSGATYDTTFRPDEKFERAFLESKDVQYLYNNGESEVFMDLETFEQYELPHDSVEDEMLFLKENMNAKIQFFGDEVIGVEVPNTVELAVQETQPSIKGATVTGSGKPATMETGLVVNVPDFIENGEVLVINTTDGGSYKSRAK
ncbi:elongation factor P [Aerococcus kribbianus]|uniref:Elongation factor P n=1 Tax=Aerococcus kribbianus TaxID=2999064 RepID=A0A9X3JEH5_9LACT|nr:MULTISPECIES: elongation factor P [unclassified Aerococcus]MCZ0717154.1 elongation factor P [Aerococcus sp. YH-aer221]MCZ0725442.1 elongation factor P [Aerococcus sp. YH-aer222]